MARRLLIALASLALFAFGAAPAHAQVLHGPPAPGSQPSQVAQPVLPESVTILDQQAAAAIRPDAMNPLSIIAGAGDAILSRSGSSSTAPTSSASQPRGLSTALNILVVLTVITLAPSIVLMCTCFVRILIVLGFLRQALGTASIPPPQVTTALALFATLLVMTPTIQRINTEAIAPYQAGVITDYDTLWNAAKQPLRDFMFDQIEASGNWGAVYTILDYRGIDTSEPEKLTRAHVDMVTLVPSFILSELKVAFLMGFKVFLPFLVIDMVVSTMLISMGMMMLPPVLISLPFKILLFILVDGWALVIGSLMRSFRHAPPEVAAVTLPDALAWVGAHGLAFAQQGLALARAGGLA